MYETIPIAEWRFYVLCPVRNDEMNIFMLLSKQYK